MDEEKYTRDSAKKSARNKGRDEKSRTAEKKHGSKLKNEASANKSYRDKLRYGKRIIISLPERKSSFAK